jgi:hypothetical protein
MKETITTPTMKIKTPMKYINCKKIFEKLTVNTFSVAVKIPNPNFSPKRIRKMLDATHNVKLTMARLVCNFLLSKSFTGKKVSLI